MPFPVFVLFCWPAVSLFHVRSVLLMRSLSVSCLVCSVNQQSACFISGLFCWSAVFLFNVTFNLWMSSLSVSCLVFSINKISLCIKKQYRSGAALESSSENSQHNEMWRFLTPFQIQSFWEDRRFCQTYRIYKQNPICHPQTGALPTITYQTFSVSSTEIY